MPALFTALGLVLVIEGLLYALVPGQLRRMAELLRQVTDDQLRIGGASAIALGVLIVWITRSVSG
ncbi:MAG: DUF2065 domain-containing protein [Alphaproteobacteria bacterium]|nr:DUF2065 domain-containing protein [Alphaproteobacteria bacterium]